MATRSPPEPSAEQRGPDRFNVPNEDTGIEPVPKARLNPSPGHEPRGVEKGIADADKKARTGEVKEAVRNTPPFGDFDETVPKD